MMNKAVFLDRDGVINKDTGYVYKAEDFHFLNGIFHFCRVAQKNGYLLIVVTNQAGIARGYYTEDDFLALNRWMLERFKEEGIQIASVYYCPFHPKHGIGIYRQDSKDRKPNPGMLLKAQDQFQIDLSHSVLIGDKDSDIEAGYAAGVGQIIALHGRYALKEAPGVIHINSLKEALHVLYNS